MVVHTPSAVQVVRKQRATTTAHLAYKHIVTLTEMWAYQKAVRYATQSLMLLSLLLLIGASSKRTTSNAIICSV